MSLTKNNSSVFPLPFLPQIIYDEGPLYIFAKSEDIRNQWIKKLKESKYMRTNIHTCIWCLCVLSFTVSHAQY